MVVDEAWGVTVVVTVSVSTFYRFGRSASEREVACDARQCFHASKLTVTGAAVFVIVLLLVVFLVTAHLFTVHITPEGVERVRVFVARASSAVSACSPSALALNVLIVCCQ